MAYTNEAIAYTVDQVVRHGTPLAYYQATEIPQQIKDFCEFLNRPPIADETTIRFALGNLLVS